MKGNPTRLDSDPAIKHMLEHVGTAIFLGLSSCKPQISVTSQKVPRAILVCVHRRQRCKQQPAIRESKSGNDMSKQCIVLVCNLLFGQQPQSHTYNKIRPANDIDQPCSGASFSCWPTMSRIKPVCFGQSFIIPRYGGNPVTILTTGTCPNQNWWHPKQWWNLIFPAAYIAVVKSSYIQTNAYM